MYDNIDVTDERDTFAPPEEKPTDADLAVAHLQDAIAKLEKVSAYGYEKEIEGAITRLRHIMFILQVPF